MKGGELRVFTPEAEGRSVCLERHERSFVKDRGKMKRHEPRLSRGGVFDAPEGGKHEFAAAGQVFNRDLKSEHTAGRRFPASLNGECAVGVFAEGESDMVVGIELLSVGEALPCCLNNISVFVDGEQGASVRTAVQRGRLVSDGGIDERVSPGIMDARKFFFLSGHASESGCMAGIRDFSVGENFSVVKTFQMDDSGVFDNDFHPFCAECQFIVFFLKVHGAYIQSKDCGGCDGEAERFCFHRMIFFLIVYLCHFSSEP